MLHWRAKRKATVETRSLGPAIATPEVVDQALILALEAPFRSLAEEAHATQLCEPSDILAFVHTTFLHDLVRLRRGDWGVGAAISVPDRLPDRQRTAAVVAPPQRRSAIG